MNDNTVFIRVNFESTWQPFKVLDEDLRDLEIAKKLIRHLGIKNVELKMCDEVGSVLMWDNF